MTRSRGFTLLEVTVGFAIITFVVLGATTMLRNQLDVVSHVADNDYTFQPAQSALWKVRDELLSVVQSPASVTNDVAPVYQVSAPDASASLPTASTPFKVTTPFSSITWRPVIGVPTTNDPTFADYYANPTNWTGCLSKNGVLYSKTAKTLWVDAKSDPKFGTVYVLRLDEIDNAHTTANPIRSQVLVGNEKIGESVSAFRLFKAESNHNFNWSSSGVSGSAYAPGIDNNFQYYLIGVYLRVEHKSVLSMSYRTSVAGGGANASSSFDNSSKLNRTLPIVEEPSVLRMSVLVAPETLSSSNQKPFVGP